MLKSSILTLFAFVQCIAAYAAPPQLFLDVARFRNLNKVEKGAEVEIYVTVPTQTLTYRQRAPKQFQSAATVTLEVLKANGQSAYREIITLKPPVINDTTMAIKNPQSFLKRILLPDGRYTLRGTVRDQYKSVNGETIVERPLVLEAPSAGLYLTDIVLLAKTVGRSTGDDNFSRGGFQLTRTPMGFYGRGTEKVFFYAELNQAEAGQPLQVRYRLQGTTKPGAKAEMQITPQAGRPSIIVGQLPLGDLPDGNFTLFIEVYGGPGGKKLLVGHRVQGIRSQVEYAPSGAAAR